MNEVHSKTEDNVQEYDTVAKITVRESREKSKCTKVVVIVVSNLSTGGVKELGQGNDILRAFYHYELNMVNRSLEKAPFQISFGRNGFCSRMVLLRHMLLI